MNRKYRVGLMVMASALSAITLRNSEDGDIEGTEDGEGQGNGGGEVPPTTTPATPEVPKPVTEVIVGTKDGVKYLRQEFKVSKKSGTATALTGWGFAVPKFTSLSQAKDHFDKLAKEQNRADINGENIILDSLQSALEAKLRIRVKNSVPNFTKAGEEDDYFEGKAKKDPTKLLFNIDEASTWLPGVRELSMKKQVDEAMKKVTDMIKDKNFGPTHPEVQKLLLEVAIMQASA